MRSARAVEDDPSSLAGYDVLRPVFVGGFMLAFGGLLCLFTHRLAVSTKRNSISRVHALTLLLLGSSVSFAFVAGLLTLGSGPAIALNVCRAAVWVCVTLYAGSKLLVSLVLLERLFIVHGPSATRQGGRLHSPLYVVGMVLMVFWTVTVLFIIPWKRAELRPSDGACVLSLRLWTLFPPLAMDCIANLYLSIAFIMPVSRSRSAEARRLAHVSTVATLAALLVTLGNAITLAVLHGRERMFVCLGTCTLDVTGNAVIIYVVTIPRREAAPSPLGVFPRAGPTLPVFERGGSDGAGERRQNTKHAIPASRTSWHRRRSSASRSGQVDLSSISVQICREVVIDDAGEIDGHASRREYTLPRPPDACAGAGEAGGSPRSFVRAAASSSEASEGSRPLSEALSDVESCPDGLIKACQD